MSAEDYAEFAIQPYAESALLRGLVNLMPGGGAIDVALVQTRDNLLRERSRRYFEALAARKEKLRSEFGTSEPFVHRFLVTTEAAAREAEDAKIELFANLLTNGPTEAELDTSDYKAMLQILSELSERELAVLSMLSEYESTARQQHANELQRASGFWEEFRKRVVAELSVPAEEFDGFLARTSRTGCYHEITGAFLDYAGGQGYTTGLWGRFKEFVLSH